jgi:hypothetical protein
MIPFKGHLAKSVFKALSFGAYRHFNQALKSPKLAEQQLLEAICRDITQTEYGKHYQLPAKAGYEVFSSKIPIVDYDTLSPWIQNAEHQQNTLTRDKIDFFEYTSGSMGHKKVIPYTKQLRRSFARCFQIEGFDLLDNGLQLNSMKMFMSISPQVSHIPQANLKEDSEYLDGFLQWLIKPYLTTQPNIRQLPEEDFRFILALTLLAQEQLEIISIWSPSYLLMLLQVIEQRFDELQWYLSKGSFSYKDVPISLPLLTRSRQQYLKDLQKNYQSEFIWPTLKLISCWKAGTSKRIAGILANKFPATIIHGKGLLATEGPLTVPLVQAKGYVPMLQDIFFEFDDGRQNILRLEDLRVDEEYEMIISQRSGLYRYRIGDSVRVTHFFEQTPCLEFIGRTKQICDLVGEKLNERFVMKVFEEEPFARAQYLLLVPTLLASGQGKYYLLTDHPHLVLHTTSLDSLLSTNFHYQNARKMLQLLEPQILFHPQIAALLSNMRQSLGIKMGDQKECALIRCPKEGEFLVEEMLQHKG